MQVMSGSNDILSFRGIILASLRRGSCSLLELTDGQWKARFFIIGYKVGFVQPLIKNGQFSRALEMRDEKESIIRPISEISQEATYRLRPLEFDKYVTLAFDWASELHGLKRRYKKSVKLQLIDREVWEAIDSTT